MTVPINQPNVFIDTNIWVYAFSAAQDKVKTQKARALIRREPSIHISTQVIDETTKNLLQKFGATEDVVRRLIRSMYRGFTVLDLSQAILLQASFLRTKYQFSFWDSTIVAGALFSKSEVLYSEDLQDGRVIEGVLRVVNPLK